MEDLVTLCTPSLPMCAASLMDLRMHDINGWVVNLMKTLVDLTLFLSVSYLQLR